MQTTDNVLIIWDSNGLPPCGEGVVYRWKGYAEEDGSYSLLRYVENNAERFRAKYLSWVHELGETMIRGKRLIDHLALGDGLSYWWLTLFVEKSPFKSPISDALRLMALEEILLKQRPIKVLLVSDNKFLHECIDLLCKNLHIPYRFKKLPSLNTRKDLRWFYYLLPYAIRALFTLLRHVITHWPLRKIGSFHWFSGHSAVFFCSYFIHLDQDSCARGLFYSRQWEILPQLLEKRGIKLNWIHHYLKSSVTPNTRIATEWIRRFNENNACNAFHSFLDSFLSFKVIWSAFSNWVNLFRLSLMLHKIKAAFKPSDSRLSFWPLMRNDWWNSLQGPVAMDNLLKLHLFDAAMKSVPHQHMGLYLCENQGWERAFIHAWRKHGHGKLFGVFHSTVRFWDLRYFYDVKTISRTDTYSMPQPDANVLNGMAAISAFREAGQPMDRVIEAEALRYMYLGMLVEGRRLTSDNTGVIKLLVLGEIMADSTKKLLRLLDSAMTHVDTTLRITIKPHPYCMIRAEDYPRLNLRVITDPLGNILNDYDIAYASNSTSAGVDAYLAGLPVLVMLDDNELNMSPLRGQQGVKFVSTPRELAKALSMAKSNCGREKRRGDFFFLAPDLPRWKKLLGEQKSEVKSEGVK